MRDLLTVLVEAERCAIRTYADICNMTFGKDHRTYGLSPAILNEEIEHESFSEVLGEGPSGHFQRGMPGDSPYVARLPAAPAAPSATILHGGRGPVGFWPMSPSRASVPAARRWAEELESMALPDEILAQAPESPHGFDVEMFARIADEAAAQDTPSRQAALAALPEHGSVLDVGCGAGAGALQLVPPAAMLFGIDESPEMLGAFGERAEARGVAHAELVARWPDALHRAPTADVVICYHVLYNIPDAVPFLEGLTARARTRVVLELTAEHPLAWLRPYWHEIHGYDRPPGPTADDLIAILDELGYDIEVTRWDSPPRSRRTPDEQVAFVRQRLAVGADRDPELRDLLERHPPPERRPTVTLAWSP